LSLSIRQRHAKRSVDPGLRPISHMRPICFLEAANCGSNRVYRIGYVTSARCRGMRYLVYGFTGLSRQSAHQAVGCRNSDECLNCLAIPLPRSGDRIIEADIQMMFECAGVIAQR